MRSHGNPTLRLIGIVLSAVDGRTSRLKRELLAYVKETFDRGDPFMQSYNTTITRTTYISGSQKLGKTMFQTYPTHRVTDQYRALAREVEDRLEAIEREKPAQPGRAARVRPPMAKFAPQDEKPFNPITDKLLQAGAALLRPRRPMQMRSCSRSEGHVRPPPRWSPSDPCDGVCGI